MPPRIYEVLHRDSGAVILDVGGGGEGSRVLGGLRQHFGQVAYEHLLVVNPRRPATGTVKGILRTAAAIAEVARLPHTGIVSNPNLGSATSLPQVCTDHQKVVEAANRLELPIRWICVRTALVDAFRRGCGQRFQEPVLPIETWLLPAWERNETGPLKREVTEREHKAH